MSDISRNIVLKNDIQQITLLEEFIETLASEIAIPDGILMEINLALEEAVTNVILYAYPKDSVGYVDVCAQSNGAILSLTLSDSGQEFDPTQAPEADITLDAMDRPIGGLGIHLVRTIMDTVAYRRENGKNILTMTKKYK